MWMNRYRPEKQTDIIFRNDLSDRRMRGQRQTAGNISRKNRIVMVGKWFGFRRIDVRNDEGCVMR